MEDYKNVSKKEIKKYKQDVLKGMKRIPKMEIWANYIITNLETFKKLKEILK